MKYDRVKLTAALVEAFAGAFLSPLYDNPQPTPKFHRECWELYCTDFPACAVAAPRGHAKSTALTHDYVLATILFRDEDYVVLVSATEDLAIEHLGDIAKELRENDELIAEFGITGMEVDSKTDIIVCFQDGHKARVRVKGSGQKMRGMKWMGKRPGLIVCDDLEEDEQVENIDRRRKFSRWFYRALLPSLRRGGKVRLHGTILHEDALLARLMRPKVTSWKTKLYKAHASFDDFSNILWPEQFPEERLRGIRQQFVDDQDGPGYSQEMLNDPLDHNEKYLRKHDFLGMNEADHDVEKRIAIGCDFAVSKADTANRTSFTVGGEDARNFLHIFDQHVGRWDTNEWMELLFILQDRYDPFAIYVEDGVIWKSVAPMIFKEMMRTRVWCNFVPILPIKDKKTRGRNFQKRHKAGAMRFDKEAEWYENYEQECLKFTGDADALLDDQFDSTAILVKGLDLQPDVEDEDFDTDEEIDFRNQDPRKLMGRDQVTGY